MENFKDWFKISLSRQMFQIVKTTLEKVGVGGVGAFSSLLFFIFTPLLPKVRVWEGVYVEPLLVLLVLGLFLVVLGLWKKGSLNSLFGKIKRLILPNRLALFYFLLIAALLASFVYGYFLTRFFLWTIFCTWPNLPSISCLFPWQFTPGNF